MRITDIVDDLSRIDEALVDPSKPAPAAQPARQTAYADHPGNPADWAKGMNPPPDWVKNKQTNQYEPEKKEVPGTLRSGDGSAVPDGSGNPVQAGTQIVSPPTQPATEPAAVATPVRQPGTVDVKPLPPQNDPTADNSGAPPAAVPSKPAPAAQPAKAYANGTLGLGSTGPEVKALQKRLGITDDGTFGPATRDAVIALQKKLGVTPDGKYGPQTKAADTQQAPAQSGSSQKVAPDLSAVQSGTGAIPADANKGEPYWVNGTRYEWKVSRGGGSWQATAEPTDKLQWNSTRARSMSKYTGPDSQYGQQTAPATSESTGFTNESLERIMSLVHYR